MGGREGEDKGDARGAFDVNARDEIIWRAESEGLYSDDHRKRNGPTRVKEWLSC